MMVLNAMTATSFIVTLTAMVVAAALTAVMMRTAVQLLQLWLLWDQ
jgi:hypothetical protein